MALTVTSDTLAASVGCNLIRTMDGPKTFLLHFVGRTVMKIVVVLLDYGYGKELT